MPATEDPLALFASERTKAFEAKDPMAALCSVATVDDQGIPSVRTLVLRDLDGKLALFVNATSPKWPGLQKQFSVMTYWPSVQIQYRMQVTGKPVPHEVVAESWLLRPDAPKRMDWFYEQVQRQSTAIGDRETLLKKLEGVELPEPLVAPENAKGIELVVEVVERLDLNQGDGVHERREWSPKDDAWIDRVFVP